MTRRLLVVISAAVLCVVPGLGMAAPASTPGPDGWWASLPVGLPVPADGLAVSVVNGEPDRIAALAVVLDIDETATLERLEMALKEDATPGSNLSVATPPGAPAPLPQTPFTAAIAACPATKAWQSARGGAASAAPTFDCNKARADGERGSDGTWIFNITSIARLWLGSLANNGLVLVEASAAPAIWQVTFEDVASGGVRLDSTVTEAEPGEEPVEETTSSNSSNDTFFEPTPTFDDSSSGDLPTFSGPPPLTPPATAAPNVAAPRVTATQPDSRAGDVFGNLSVPTLVLIPLLLALAGLLAYTLGPAGDPGVAGARRIGSVSRALARRQPPRLLEEA